MHFHMKTASTFHSESKKTARGKGGDEERVGMTELRDVDRLYLLFIDLTPEEVSKRETHIRGIIGISKQDKD